jgi:MYXO-CTERM domain-containing protein
MRLGLWVTVLAASAAARANVFDANFTETLVTTRGSEITSMGWAPDGSGRLFLTAKGGNVWIVQNGAALPQPFVTLSPVFTNSECGLLGIAFDPKFMDNGYVYFFVTRSAGEQQIVRYTAVGNAGTNLTPIITGLDTAGQNHDGGGLGFGPDGMIYWAIGNNGNGTGQGADLVRSASKVGRASPVPGAAPPADNPFNDGAGPNFDYIWARGFRNPFTMTFEPARGRLWVNVVGDDIEQIFIVGKGDHVGYPSEDPEPGTTLATISPAVIYWTRDPPARPIVSISRSGDVVTVTTSVVNGFRKGIEVTIAGTTGFNTAQPVPIRSIESTTVFTITQPGTNNQSDTTGTATILDFGNVVTGGTFYDASQFPAAYRGNLFFGDFGQGSIGRVILAGDGTVADAQLWGDSIGSWIDSSVGPDGALWYVGHGGEIFRTVYNAAPQGVVVMPLHLRLQEGGRGVVNVRLQQQPAQNVTVTAAFMGGSDADVTMTGAPLTFTPQNWDQPQTITVAAAHDADTTDDTATIQVTGPTTETVLVQVTDDNSLPPPDAGPIDAPVAVIDGPPGPDAPPAIDAPPGPDSPPRPDAPLQADGGLGATTSSCSCGVGAGPGGGSVVLALLVLVVLRRRRR